VLKPDNLETEIFIAYVIETSIIERDCPQQLSGALHWTEPTQRTGFLARPESAQKGKSK
jgi:hypothetical protein